MDKRCVAAIVVLAAVSVTAMSLVVKMRRDVQAGRAALAAYEAEGESGDAGWAGATPPDDPWSGGWGAGAGGMGGRGSNAAPSGVGTPPGGMGGMGMGVSGGAPGGATGGMGMGMPGPGAWGGRPGGGQGMWQMPGGSAGAAPQAAGAPSRRARQAGGAQGGGSPDRPTRSPAGGAGMPAGGRPPAGGGFAGAMPWGGGVGVAPGTGAGPWTGGGMGAGPWGGVTPRSIAGSGAGRGPAGEASGGRRGTQGTTPPPAPSAQPRTGTGFPGAGAFAGPGAFPAAGGFGDPGTFPAAGAFPAPPSGLPGAPSAPTGPAQPSEARILAVMDLVQTLSPDEYTQKRAELGRWLGSLLALPETGRGSGLPFPPFAPSVPGGWPFPGIGGGEVGPPPPLGEADALRFETVRALFAVIEPAYRARKASKADMTAVNALLADARVALYAGKLTDAQDLLRKSARALGVMDPRLAAAPVPAANAPAEH